jgi:uncharacterized protein
MTAGETTPAPATDAIDQLGYFRFGRIAGKVLLTTDAGDWAFLTEREFGQLLAGEVKDGHPRFAELQRGGFLREGLDLDALATRFAPRVGHVARGPELHVVTMTRRAAGHAGQAAAPAAGADLDRATAERIVDVALQSRSPSIAFELQALAGEPLVHLDGVRHFVEYARTTNARAAGKRLRFTLVTNTSAMTEDTAEWLIANEVAIRTWLDGPAELHDANRQHTVAAPHADVVRWIAWFDRRYRELGLNPDVWFVDARTTVTRRTLSAWRAVVDEYVARGLRSIELRPLTPLGFDAGAWQSIGYGVEEYLAFYDQAFGYVLERNRGGARLAERTAAGLLHGILPSGDPAACEFRSPSRAGTSEVAYDVDGRVFPGDEARRVDASGDAMFALGNIRQLSIADIVRHPTTRAIATASLLDTQPMCSDCWNKPFCGLSPVTTYVRDGDLFGQPPRSFECKELTAVARSLFTLLANENDPGTREILERWAPGDAQLR